MDLSVIAWWMWLLAAACALFLTWLSSERLNWPDSISQCFLVSSLGSWCCQFHPIRKMGLELVKNPSTQV